MICTLCPRNCGAERTESKAGGFCGMPAMPVAAKAMLHRWEEPCLTGEHGAGTVFFSGCNLCCCFCQNQPISQEGVGKAVIPYCSAPVLIRYFACAQYDKVIIRVKCLSLFSSWLLRSISIVFALFIWAFPVHFADGLLCLFHNSVHQHFAVTVWAFHRYHLPSVPHFPQGPQAADCAPGQFFSARPPA